MKNTPKFKIIENYIKEQIAKDRLKVGDQIMTEEQLCNHFNVSRMTVNKAISNLTDLGYINRIPGKGSFVTTPHITKNVNKKTSFTQDMIDIGLKPGSKLISYNIIRGKDVPLVAKALNLNDDSLMHFFIRLRTGNNTPIAISYTYISVDVIPAIDIKALDGSFYDFLNKINIKRTYLDWDIKASMPSQKQKELLKINDNDTAILKICHTTFCNIDNIDVPFEYIETCYNSDLYSYQLRTSVE